MSVTVYLFVIITFSIMYLISMYLWKDIVDFNRKLLKNEREENDLLWEKYQDVLEINMELNQTIINLDLENDYLWDKVDTLLNKEEICIV